MAISTNDNEIEALKLSELNLTIKHKIKEAFADSYWITAEIASINEHSYSGHCYLELVEKEEDNDNIKAKIRGQIWRNNYNLIKVYFEHETGYSLCEGMQIMVCVTVGFHELYGLSLNIIDINPSFSLGDLERRREEIRKQLKKDGVWDMNQNLSFPTFPQRIAIISSSTAAGYGDFMNQLEHNPYGYKFYTSLFNATMQGNFSEDSIINALGRIFEYQNEFDLVVILRGGGATSDLSCFDSYLLNFNCAQFPLPIISAIGHERDTTILDEISNQRAKTPTAAADIIINQVLISFSKMYNNCQTFFKLSKKILSEEIERNYQHRLFIKDYYKETLKNESVKISSFHSQLLHKSKNLIQSKKIELNIIQKNIVQVINQQILEEKRNIGQQYSALKNISNSHIKQGYNIIATIQKRLKTVCRNIIDKQNSKIEYITKQNQLISPNEILKKGYTITTKNGKSIVFQDININDTLTTHTINGKIISKVTQKE